MLKCGLVQEGLSSMEESDGNYSDPPQKARIILSMLCQ